MLRLHNALHVVTLFRVRSFVRVSFEDPVAAVASVKSCSARLRAKPTVI
jgi:hypothetical protein